MNLENYETSNLKKKETETLCGVKLKNINKKNKSTLGKRGNKRIREKQNMTNGKFIKHAESPKIIYMIYLYPPPPPTWEFFSPERDLSG